MMYALVHLLTSVAMLRYSHSAFFTLTRRESYPKSLAEAFSPCPHELVRALIHAT